jgi:hypothetical protein
MSALSKFPHVLDTIKTVWGNSEWLTIYINSVLIQDREKRQGFPPAVFDELVRLQQTHDVLYGKYELFKAPMFSFSSGDKISHR